MNFTGKILLSLPNMQDSRFHKSVIYVCAHSKEGAMGFIINKSLEMEFYPGLLKQLGIDQLPQNKKILFNYGGPVEPNRGFILHSDDFIKTESITIDDGLALTSTAEIFNNLSKGGGPKNSMLAIGYTGWGPGQLEEEILNNGWMFTKASSNFIFNEDSSAKWKNAYKIIGIDPYSINKNSGKA